MQYQIRLDDFLQRRPECRNELMGKFSNETDGVGNQYRVVAAELNPTDQSIQRGKQPIRDQRVFL